MAEDKNTENDSGFSEPPIVEDSPVKETFEKEEPKKEREEKPKTKAKKKPKKVSKSYEDMSKYVFAIAAPRSREKNYSYKAFDKDPLSSYLAGPPSSNGGGDFKTVEEASSELTVCETDLVNTLLLFLFSRGGAIVGKDIVTGFSSGEFLVFNGEETESVSYEEMEVRLKKDKAIGIIV